MTGVVSSNGRHSRRGTLYSSLAPSARPMGPMARPEDGSPSCLLADVHEALSTGDLSTLKQWSDVVGWLPPAPEQDPDRPDRTLWNHERAGTFPRRVQLTTDRVAWRESDVAAWIASQPSR